MSNTNDTSRLATFEDHDTLADTELDAVSGGKASSVSPPITLLKLRYPT